MKTQLLKIISFISLSLLGIIGILKIWEVINWRGDIETKIMVTLGIIFVVTTLIYGVLQRDIKK